MKLALLLLLAGIAWMVCGFVAAGWLYSDRAYVWRDYPRDNDVAKGERRQDLSMFLLFGFLFGPIALFIAALVTGFGERGWWKTWIAEDRKPTVQSPSADSKERQTGAQGGQQ